MDQVRVAVPVQVAWYDACACAAQSNPDVVHVVGSGFIGARDAAVYFAQLQLPILAS